MLQYKIYHAARSHERQMSGTDAAV
jgi:hypothetical protein